MEYWKPYLRKYMDYREIKYLFNNLYDISPNKQDIFKVFQSHPNDVKVIILGKSPYTNLGMATGLAYENAWENSKEELKKGILKKDIIPKELEIIYKELSNDYPDFQGITHWQKQGVFLLNAALTSKRSNDEAHLKYWKPFTEKVIKHLSNTKENKVWILWGDGPKSFIPCIKNPFIVNHTKNNIKGIPIFKGRNYVLTSESPMSEYWGLGGFYNKNLFFKTNVILEKSKMVKIKW